MVNTFQIFTALDAKAQYIAYRLTRRKHKTFIAIDFESFMGTNKATTFYLTTHKRVLRHLVNKFKEKV